MPDLFIATGIFHPEAGGPATYLYELLPRLQARGWRVEVLTYGSGPVDAYPYPVTRIPRRALPLRLAGYARAARAGLRHVDLVYQHTLSLPLVGVTAPRVLKIVGDQAWERSIRRGWITRTTDIDTFQTARYGPAANLQKMLRSREVRGMDGIIVPSHYLKRMVISWGVNPAKIQVIYNALPPAESRVQRTQAQARTELDLDTAAPLVLTAARLEPWKGVNHLIAALISVPDVRLLVAGDGPEKPRLQQQAAAAGLGDRVTFLGRVPRERLDVYMQSADYFALYSGYEGLPHVLLESLRAGTPVIASDKGGNPEVVQPGVNGLLVPYVDVDTLAQTLRDAFAPGQRAKLAANSSAGMDRFDFDHMIEQTAAALAGFVRD